MRTVNDIILSAKNALLRINSPLANFSRYSNIYAILRSVATIISELDFKIKTNRDTFYIFSAVGEDLDYRALDFGLTRKQGVLSTGSVLVESSIGNTNVPAGLILSTADSAFQYEVVSEGFVGSSETTLKIRALVKGATYNLPAGTRLYSSFMPSLKFTVGQYRNSLTRGAEGPLLGGLDPEDDDTFKDRILRNLQSIGKGSIASVEAALLAIPGINKVFIKESYPASGYITAFINSQDTRLIEAAQVAIQVNKCAGISFVVESVETTPVNINVLIKIKDFNDSARITSQVRSVLTRYFNDMQLGQGADPLTLNALVISIPGISDSEILFPTSFIAPTQQAGLLTLSNLNITLQQ